MGLPKGTRRPDTVDISTANILHHMKLTGMSYNSIKDITGTDMRYIMRYERSTIPVIQKVARCLRCRVEDLIVGELPEVGEDTKMVTFGPQCHETKPCFGRSEDGHCKVLARGYEQGHRCPFRKEKRSK